MKIVLAGGTGQIGQILSRWFRAKGDEVVVIARSGEVKWDGKSEGPWFKAIDGADVVINLAGRSVNCRYSEKNKKEMMDSRVDSTRILGRAIAAAASPPRVWLQMSTATIYAHRLDAANGDDGIIGGSEPDVPAYWKFSVEIAQNWERAQAESPTPRTRQVALRSTIVLSPDKGGIFSVLSNLARSGLGGPVAGGRQFVSWIHAEDFARAVDFIIAHESIRGPINIASPSPLPQREFMRVLRREVGMPVGLPATAWMAEVGAFVLRTDTELLLKSRRVVPSKLLGMGFEFRYPEWAAAARDLVN